MSGEQNELATNRLLEILRGNKNPTAGIEEVEIGLSKDEERELLTSNGESPIQPPTSQKRSLRDLAEQYIINGSKKYLKKLISEKHGFIGLDIGTHAVKYVLFQPTSLGMKLIDYGIEIIPQQENEKQIPDEVKVAVLRRLLPTDILNDYHLISAVCGPKVSIRHILLPQVPKKELEAAILWNAKKDLNFPGENALVDYQILGDMVDKGITKHSVFVALADNEVIQSHLELLSLAGMQPIRIIAVPMAIYNTFLFCANKDQVVDGIIIDVGARNTYIIFIHQKNFQFAREITLGGEDITQGLMGSVNTSSGPVTIDRNEAERLKIRYGIPDESAIEKVEHDISLSQIGSLIRPVAERLQVQIQRSIDFYRSKFPFEESTPVYLSGGGTQIRNIQPFLEEGLGREVRIINPFDSLQIADTVHDRSLFERNISSLSVSFGIAIKGKKGLNLLPEEIKIQPFLAMQKRIMKIAAVLLVLIIGYFSYEVTTQANELEKQLQQVKNFATEANPQLKEYLQLQETKETLTNKKKNFETQINQISPGVDMVGILKLISNMTPEYITINSLKIGGDDGKSITLKGEVQKRVSHPEVLLLDFNQRLYSTGFFSQVSPYTEIASEVESGNMGFQIECIVK